MDALRSFILQNRSILDPALRTTCSLIGLAMLAAASYSLFSPQEFSSSVFRLPLSPFTPTSPTNPAKSSSTSSTKPKTLPAANPKAWLVPFAGREAALGCAILGLLWLGELRILSLMFLPMMTQQGWLVDLRDDPDFDFFDYETRHNPTRNLYTHEVTCWPSVGGIIMAKRAHSVELEYIGFDRFHPTLRSYNATEEDQFCMKLRKIGGKWWSSFDDHEFTTLMAGRGMYPDEIETLFLGWPADGGVWILRYESWRLVNWTLGPIFHALTMEERCKAIEICGGTFFEDPEDCQFVKPLIEGFGEHEDRPDLTTDEGGRWDWMFDRSNGSLRPA
ncbi:hypothetical protein EG329_008210 [Mollisiaceae sp. DMI_Dod_QoI]|nr:hypothetical protein EG329_008210 [Helotiales sp. DMI_Dod_QoI]